MKPHLGAYLKHFFLNTPDPCRFMIPFDYCFFFFQNGWGKKTHQLFTKSHEMLTVQKSVEASASKESPKQGATDEPEPMAEPEAEDEVLNLGDFVV